MRSGSAIARTSVTVAPAALAVVVGTALALVGAVVGSALEPLGTSRLIESEHSIWVEPLVLVIGAAVFVGGLVLVSAIVLRLDRLPRRAPRAAGGPLHRSLTRTLGQDLAYRQGGLGLLAMVATGVGLGLVVAVTVYTASVDGLTASPARFGSDYDLVLYPADDGGFTDFDFDQPGIEGAAVSTGGQATQ